MTAPIVAPLQLAGEQVETTTLAKNPNAFESVGMFFYLFFCLGPALEIKDAFDTDVHRNLGALVLQLCSYGLLLPAIIKDWKRFRQLLWSRRTVFAQALAALAIVSTLWSVDPGLTFRRALALLATNVIAVYFATRWSVSDQLRILSTLLLTAVILSLLAGLALPEYGRMPAGYIGNVTGNWRGIFPHKNTFGRFSALAALVFLFRYRGSRGWTSVWWAIAMAMTGIALALSRSVTSVLTVVIVLVLQPLTRLLRTRLLLPGVLAFSLALAGGVGLLNKHLDAVLSAVGRDATLSGRLQLWLAAALLGARQNPWLGYGYNAFWRGTTGDSGILWKMVGWQAPNIHNGVIDLWLVLGFAGVITFAIGYLATVGRAIRYARLVTTPERFWPISFLAFLALQNATETVLVGQNSLIWLLYVVVLCVVWAPMPRSDRASPRGRGR